MSDKVLFTGGAGFLGSQVADISEARQLLGYEPRTYLDEGLAELAQWLTGRVVIDWADQAILALENRGLTL